MSARPDRSDDDDPGTFDPALFVKWRDDHGLTQRDLARALDYTPTLISKIEHGERAPTQRFFKLLELHYRLSARRLFYRRNGATR